MQKPARFWKSDQTLKVCFDTFFFFEPIWLVLHRFFKFKKIRFTSDDFYFLPVVVQGIFLLLILVGHF
jgi:hypothetical protein